MVIEHHKKVKVIHEYLVKINNTQEPIKCRITETKNKELPFSYEAELVSEHESINNETFEEAFTNLTKYIGNLIEPHQVNENY